MENDFEPQVDKSVIANLIIVERDPMGYATVTVDGYKLPWALAEEVAADVTYGRAPSVSLKILARRVEVRDSYLVGVDVSRHEHEPLSNPEDFSSDLENPEYVTPEKPRQAILDLDEDAEHEKLRNRIIEDLVAGRNPRKPQ